MQIKIRKKHIPWICLIILILIAWIEEIVIGEGFLHNYIYQENHLALRGIIRIGYVFILFLVSYAGLKSLGNKWVLSMLIMWFIFVLLSGGIRILVPLVTHRLEGNIWSFLNGFYAFALTPFPFIFLWFLARITK